jgi:hypothetical protein
MNNWSELSSREPNQDLPRASQRLLQEGVTRYTFVHNDLEIDNPSLEPSSLHFVSPREYGFSIRGFQGGKTAWARDFANGTMLVVNADGQSHVLSPRGGSRVLFVDRDGTLLQDSGSAMRAPPRAPDLATVRLTLTATVDLQGESPEAARALLMRMVDRAVLSGALPGEPDIRVLEHAFEGSAVLSADDRPGSTDTDFSQLLDL